MFNKEDILARLQRGEDAQKIANEFADLLNGVIEEKAQADAASKRQNEKIKDAEHMINAIMDYMGKWYPDLELGDIEYDTLEVMDAIDTVVPEVRKLMELAKKVEKLAVPAPKITATDPFAAFFKFHNL